MHISMYRIGLIKTKISHVYTEHQILYPFNIIAKQLLDVQLKTILFIVPLGALPQPRKVLKDAFDLQTMY